jgi:hypothetical protein
VTEECHLHHLFFCAFWINFGTWLMALTALLWLYEEKALFVGVRPFSSGITGEAVKTTVIFQSGAACALAALHSCTCTFDFETPSEKNFTFHTRSIPLFETTSRHTSISLCPLPSSIRLLLVVHTWYHIFIYIQQYVMLRFYGLDGDAPESIASISRRLSPTNPKVTIARNWYNNAIMSLRRKLVQ